MGVRAAATRFVRAGALLGLVVGLGATAATALSAEDLARVSVEPSAKVVWVGERFELDVKITINDELRRDGWPQLFAQKLDVPVQLEAPWIDAPHFGRVLPWASDPDTSDSIELSFAREAGPALVVWASGTSICGRDDAGEPQSWSLLTYRREFVAERSGHFTLAAPRVRYATTASVEHDVFNDPVAVDTRFVTVEGKSVELEVRALPEAGRPASFSGAIGTFEISTEATRRELAVGDELELVLTIKGDRELDALAAPRLAESTGWHLLGVLADTTVAPVESLERAPDRSPPRRVFRYHLQATSTSVSRTPAIEFSYFAPGEGAYHTLTSETIALRVAAREAPTEPDEDAREVPRPIHWVSGVGALVVLCATIFVWRARRREPVDPRPDRARGALAKLKSALEQRGANPETAFTTFVADQLDIATSAVSGHDLARRLRDAGASPELAERAARTLDVHVAARFGGAAPEVERTQLLALAAELDAALRATALRRA
ncbi:MAG: hypothetical protein K8S98_03665 [Planctomycetes bacterium]|nr:hypothetical protein [Planctomycetota bacterium]